MANPGLPGMVLFRSIAPVSRRDSGFLSVLVRRRGHLPLWASVALIPLQGCSETLSAYSGGLGTGGSTLLCPDRGRAACLSQPARVSPGGGRFHVSSRGAPGSAARRRLGCHGAVKGQAENDSGSWDLNRRVLLASTARGAQLTPSHTHRGDAPVFLPAL